MAKKKKDESFNTKTFEAEKDDGFENFASKQESEIYKTCLKFYPKIKKAYENKDDINSQIVEFWNIYNAQTDDNQQYVGNSQSYIPAARDAINARAKRALKQNFANKYKHVEAVGADSRKPTAEISLLEHYIRTTKLKTICRSLLVAGDVTGQWNVYVDWFSDKRTITNVIKRPAMMETVEGERVELADPTEEKEEISDETVVEQGPTVVDFATEDLAVIPPTCNDIEKADIVSLKLRMSQSDVQDMIDAGIFILPTDSEIEDWMDQTKEARDKNPAKKATSDAGIKTEGSLKYALIYEATARVKLDDGNKHLVYIWYAGENEILGIIKAPQWGGKRPTISAPVERIAGSFFGISKLEAVKWMQWNLNDFWNMGQDSAMYSLLPVIMTDPEKNPNYASMVYGLAAVWAVDPNSTKFAEFPSLWKDAEAMCMSIEARINKTLDVTPMMLGMVPPGRKNANMVGAQQMEQSIPILDHAERFEEVILNELLERFFEYDCQWRNEEISVLSVGELGLDASIQKIPPMQWGNRYFFQWYGTNFVLSMQQMQQQIATMNVLRGVPTQQLNGRKVDVGPVLDLLVSNVFGNELGSQILIDDRNKYSVPADLEDEMMINHIMVDIHEADDDIQHIRSHQEAARVSGDPAGLIRTHVEQHMMQLQKKRQMNQPPPPPKGMPGVPGGAGPGVAGTPRPGAIPAGPRPGMQQPAGAIHPDVMPGAVPRG